MVVEIKRYLNNKADSELKYHENQKNFSAVKVYLFEEIERNKEYVFYCWVLRESAYCKNGEIIIDSASSIPHRFTVKQNGENFYVSDSRIPRDGSYYPEDMKQLFPAYVRYEMSKFHNDGSYESLKLDIDEQINLYFNK